MQIPLREGIRGVKAKRIEGERVGDFMYNCTKFLLNLIWSLKATPRWPACQILVKLASSQWCENGLDLVNHT